MRRDPDDGGHVPPKPPLDPPMSNINTVFMATGQDKWQDTSSQKTRVHLCSYQTDETKALYRKLVDLIQPYVTRSKTESGSRT